MINYTPKVKKSYVVLDTSVLVHDPSCIDYYKGHTVVVTGTVLQELDNLKDKLIGVKARNVRMAIKSLERFAEADGDITKGITLKSVGVTVKFIPEGPADKLPPGLCHKVPDDRILGVCLVLRDKYKTKEVLLVSNDINLGLKARMHGVEVAKYQDRLIEVSSYEGYRDEEIPESKTLDISKVVKAYHGGVPYKRNTHNFQENEFFLLRGGGSPIRCYYRKDRVYPLPTGKLVAAGIQELNLEQAYSLSLLLDPYVKLVTLTGRAGCGKTLLAMAAAIEQVMDRKVPLYEKVIISRSLTVLGGKDRLGFLPGDLKSKLQPFIMPLKDAISQILGTDHRIFEVVTGDVESVKFGKSTTGNHFQPMIEVEPLQYIRGRNIRNSFMIVDEAQNLTEQDVKTITTRMCDNSKLVLLGDLDQIDNYYVSKTSNGLSQTIEKFKDCEIAGHVQMRKGVRSELASEAAKRLGGES